MGDNQIIRKHFKISGYVQGVGFRYRAKYAADGVRVTGWVRNEWDGTVEMELQGREADINRVLVLINRSSYITIDRMITSVIPVEEEERGFHIR